MLLFQSFETKTVALVPPVKRPGSPLPEDQSKKPKVEEEAKEVDEEMASQGDEAMDTDIKELDPEQKAPLNQRVSTTDLSDVPLPPANPIPVLKNSIKLRLSR